MFWFRGGFAWLHGIPLFCLVFLCAGFDEVSTKWDATHIETQSCARARANSTMRDNRTAFVLLSTVFVQPCTIQCNARALFLIVLNQYNAIPCETFACLLLLTVLGQALAILSSTIQCNGMQSCKSPPVTPPPLPLLLLYIPTQKNLCYTFC